MKNRFGPATASLLGLILFTPVLVISAGKPLISHIYTADPSGHVWPDDPNTLWLYTSHDEPGTNHHATMFDYHVFSTTDRLNWIDHGRVLSVDDVDWAIGFAWAIDAVYRHGKYYLIFCMIEKSTGMFRTGLAISDVPQGPFTDIGFIQGVEWGQDPCLFVDDDDTPYLYWGAGGKCSAARLTDDLKSIVPGTRVDLTQQLFEVFEGPWLHKANGFYYLSYPGLPKGQWPEEMYYATAETPLGPFTCRDKYIPVFEGRAGTNHGSIVLFQNRWIAFYHAALVSGGQSEVRNLMADFLNYNPDGTIKSIVPSDSGITGGATPGCVVFLEAENGKPAGGKLAGTVADTTFPGFSGKGYVTGFDVSRDYVEVLVQTSKAMMAGLRIRLSAENDYQADVLVGVTMMAGWDGLSLRKTNGWEIIDLGPVRLREGDNRIRFTCKQNVNLKLDWFRIDPILP